jgi:hypothetical protein
MKLLVDRPWTNVLTIESGKGKGKEVMAQPTWGEDSNPIPVSVHVTINEDGDTVICTIDGPFQSIDHAEQLALKKATDWYDRVSF